MRIYEIFLDKEIEIEGTFRLLRKNMGLTCREKARTLGIIHIAIRTNYYFGGTIYSDKHKDLIFPKSTVARAKRTTFEKC